MSLIKADENQCQAIIQSGGFMSFGISQAVRCKNKPMYIAKEVRPLKGKKQRGSMSLCEKCSKVLLEGKGKSFATLKWINIS